MADATVIRADSEGVWIGDDLVLPAAYIESAERGFDTTSRMTVVIRPGMDPEVAEAARRRLSRLVDVLTINLPTPPRGSGW